MFLANAPIGRKLTAIILLASGAALALTCVFFISYEYFAFRQNLLSSLVAFGQIIATNSTAALAFDNPQDAREILTALKAQPNIEVAVLYNRDGKLFATYPANLPVNALPHALEQDGFRFEHSYLIGFEPIREGNNRRLGTVYLKSNLNALYKRIWLYSLVAAGMTAVSFMVAYLLSKVLQQQISKPVLALAATAKAVSEQRDYSVRAHKAGEDEFGLLTDAFNQMLAQIQEQDRSVRDGEARVRAIVNSALSAVVVIGTDGNIIDWNPRAEQMFGWKREELIGRELAATVLPESHRQEHRRGLQHFLATGEGPILNQLVEISALRRDGTEFPVELSISPIVADGVTTFCGFVTDITERKQAQGRVQTQLSRLDLLHQITRAIGERQDVRSIFQVVIRRLEEDMPIDFGCICLHDSAAEVLIVTSVGVRSAGLAHDLAMTEQARIAIDQNGLSRCVRGELVYEPDIRQEPFAFQKRLATAGLSAVVLAPLLVESKVFGLLITARAASHSFASADCEFLSHLSEHVALASHQAQIYGALQQAYEDIRQSQQAILQQERLRALGQIASGIAHDINNSLSPASLYTESVLEREPSLSAAGREHLLIVQRAIDDVVQTVMRMREFYRQRESQLSLAPVDLNRTVREVLNLTRAKWSDIPQEHGIVIEQRIELAPELPHIMAVESEIRDALTNLVINAADAMPAGGILVLRTLVVHEQQGPRGSPATHVLLEVSDSGVGMDEDTRRRCLEPFFTTKGERGTGLGLAMVYGMVQRHSAELEIVSALGQGTTVRLSFAGSALGADVTGPPSGPSPLPQRLRILIVDDDPLLIKSLYDTLQADGHAATTALGGQAGIDSFCSAHHGGQPFTLVITDLGMPHVDGRKVAAAVKSVSPSTPVILLTGWGQRLIGENDIPPHVDRVLAKPPKLRDLRAALAELTPEPASVGPV